MELLWVVPLGLLVGLALGSLGGGGSILTVPALVYLLGQTPRAATTGSLIIVGLTALIGAIPHYRKGNVQVARGLVFGVLGVVGSIIGARLAAGVEPTVLLSAFSMLMFVVAFLMWRRTRRTPASGPASPAATDEVPSSPATLAGTEEAASGHATLAGTDEVSSPATLAGTEEAASGRAPAGSAGKRRLSPQAWRVVLAATGVGLLTGFFGVGGGFAVVPALVLVLGLPMPRAVGTSLLVISINSATALAARLGSGVTFDWPVILGFSVFAVVGSLLGARVTQRVSPRNLTLAFVVMLVLVAGYMAAMNVPGLFR